MFNNIWGGDWIPYVCTEFGHMVYAKVLKCHILSSKLRPDN